MFWLISIALTCLIGAVVVMPLLRGGEGDVSSPDVDLYKSQLVELDNDIARGVLSEDEATLARTEIARRLLLASKSVETSTAAPQSANRIAAFACVVGAVAISFWAYVTIGSPGEPDQPLAQRHAMAEDIRTTRPSQAEFEAAAPPTPEVNAPAEYLASVEKLRQILPTRPDDLRGWTLLAFHETELLNYAAAARAQSQVLRITDGADLNDMVRLIDLLVAAANGQVSPEAENIIRTVLSRDPENVPARYYLGALYNATARPDIAFRLWRPLVDSAPDSFHVALAREQIEGAAFRAGSDYTLPTTATRGPSADDIVAAQDMTEEDRMAMIGGMVAGLANRLASDGGPASDWARLINAYGVLGETQAAAQVWAEAQTAFSGDPDAIAQLRAAAISAGVAE